MAKWRPGQSGNPKGRPRAPNYRKLLTDNAEELLSTMMKAARGGDVGALRWCCDRIVAPLKAHSELMALNLAGTLGEQGASVLEALSAGEITPEQAGVALDVLLSQAKLIEHQELQSRLERLEEAMAS